MPRTGSPGRRAVQAERGRAVRDAPVNASPRAPPRRYRHRRRMIEKRLRMDYTPSLRKNEQETAVAESIPFIPIAQREGHRRSAARRLTGALADP